MKPPLQAANARSLWSLRLHTMGAARGATELWMGKGVPGNFVATRDLFLGSVGWAGSRFTNIAGVLREDDFALEKHGHIFGADGRIYSRG